MLGGLVRQLGFLAIPWALHGAIDAGVTGNDLGAVAVWSAVLLAAAGLQFIGLCAWEYYSNLADARAGVRLRNDLLNHVLTVRGVLRTQGETGGDSVAVGDGDLVLRAGRDVESVRAWVHGLPSWVVIGVTVAVLIPGLLALDPWLLVVAVATVPCLIALNLICGPAYERAAQDLATGHGSRADAVEHVLRSAVTLRGIGAGVVLRERHRGRSAELTQRTVRASDLLARWSALGEGLPLVSVAIGVLIGVFAAQQGRLSVGGLVAFSAWMGTVGLAVRVALARVAQTVEARVAARRLREVLTDSAPTIKPSPSFELRNSGTEGPVLSTDRLCWRVGAAALDVAAGPGGLFAISGPTGSGKSTLLRTLAGWDTPASGRVCLNGVDLDRIPGEVVAREVMLVPQRPLVLAGTVRDNLCLGATQSDDRLRAVLRAAALLRGEDRYEIGTGLDAVISDGGGSLSGGQIQRLALARALLAEPTALLLDDITSAVDEETEGLMLTELLRQAQHRIVIVATHRPALLAAAIGVVTL